MYNPHDLKHNYDNLEHGKSKIEGIRHAIKEADREHDISFQLFFRIELCRESIFYSDVMDMLIVFPQALALADKHPHIEVTKYNSEFEDGMDQILWVYKWLLNACTQFYQIPLKDCMTFFEDFKKRSQAYGYNLKPYYSFLSDFYHYIDEEKEEEFMKEYEKIKRDGNADCAACERNMEIEYYLKKGEIDKAEQLSKDIENFKLTCGGRMSAWLQMKCNFMLHYLKCRDFEKAEQYCRLMEQNLNKERAFERWDAFLYCYTFTNMGKALKIYKKQWKEWMNERCPEYAFDEDKYCWVFFRQLAKEMTKDTIKLDFDKSFPLYREDANYVIADLADFYYKRALNTAQKFDERNGTDWFQRDLQSLVK